MTISINRRHSQELKTAPRNRSRFLRLTISHALAFLPDGPARLLNMLVNLGIIQKCGNEMQDTMHLVSISTPYPIRR
jgi:hypothetical protein